jgi:hypothetical protein
VPRPALHLTRVTAVALALFLEPACERRPAGPSLADHYELERTIHVAPIEPFARAPASLLVLPDGRFLLPETEGVWIHVTGADGEGITRVGGPSATPLDLPAAPRSRSCRTAACWRATERPAW